MCLQVTETAYWRLRVPTGFSGCLLEPEVAFCYPWMATAVCGYLLVSVGTYWCLRVPTGICGCLLVSLVTY